MPRDEPTVVQTQRDGENESAGALTLDPLPEAGAMTATPTPEATDVELPAGAEALVTLAQQDLARRLGLAPEVMRVASVEAAEWPDASLGCPQPGEMYAQVVTPGFRIVLEARGERYEYHTDREQATVLCEEEALMGPPTETVPSPVGSGLDSLVQSAKEDLARRLSIKVEQIEVVEAKSVVWPDASVGCPQPGSAYAHVVTLGFQVVLEVEGENYAYHTDKEQRMVYCESQGTPPGESAETVRIAREDLARRLSISVDAIDVVAVIGQQFPADAFYCRTTKERIAKDESPVVIPGESILLSAAGRRYEYHASDQTVIFCRQLR